MSDEREAIEASIDASPDDPARYAVLADWYQQRGDGRGELIALQLLPSMTAAQRRQHDALVAREHLGGGEASWRWGFVHALRYELLSRREDWADALLAPVLAHPACRFLRALELDAGPGDEALRWLSAHAPPLLTSLTLTCNEVDLSLARLARLDTLNVAAQLVTPGVLPPLRALTLPVDAMTDAGLAHVLGTQPRLRALTLTCLGAIDADTMHAVSELSTLESLTLKADLTTRAAIEVLLASRLPARLTTLDVSASGLTEDAARLLLDAVPSLARLSSLVVGQR